MSDDTVKLTLADRVLGAIYAPYKTKAIAHRTAQAGFQNLSKRDSQGRKNGSGYTTQPLGVGQIRKLTPHSRRVMIQQCREVYENNPLAHSLIERSVDNIIGEGMTPKPMSSDAGWNQAVSEWWRREYRADAMGRFSNAELQRVWFRSYLRDGDIGALMLRLGQVQTIESDYVQSPGGAGDFYTDGRSEPNIVDGFKIGASGQAQTAYVATAGTGGATTWQPVPMRNFMFHANYDRANRTATRGVPALAIVRPLLEQIDGTKEAVTMAHRMAASFGIIRTLTSPAQANNALPNLTSTPTTGDINKGFTVKPGMVESVGLNEGIVQVKPEHPTASFSEFMTTLVRFAGIPLGLPLELALLDFSKTNYSSARASLEQAYRGFRVQQNRFKDSMLTKWYRWRISKAVKMGEIEGTPPDDFLNHDWMAQPWPYLNPIEDAQGVMASIDAGMTTLTDELAKRGYTFEDWLDQKQEEIERTEEAGVPLLRSNVSRDGTSAEPPAEEPEDNPQPEQPDDDESSELPSEE